MIDSSIAHTKNCEEAPAATGRRICLKSELKCNEPYDARAACWFGDTVPLLKNTLAVPSRGGPLTRYNNTRTGANSF